MDVRICLRGVFSWNAIIYIYEAVLISTLCFLGDICVYNFCDFVCFILLSIIYYLQPTVTDMIVWLPDLNDD